MALAGFAPTGGSLSMSVGPTSTSVAIPLAGSPPTALVTNLGERAVFLGLGVGSATAVVGSGLVVPPNCGTVAITLGANTWIAAITFAGESDISVVTGT